MTLPDLGTCKHGTPMLTPCPTCDAAYGPVGAPPEVARQYLDRHILRLEAQLAETKALLREVERKMMDDSGYCHICECHGHAPDCPLAALIGGGA